MPTLRLVLPVLCALTLAACTAPPPPPPPSSPTRDPFRVDRAVVRALGDHVRAIYDARLAQELPQAAPEADPEALQARLELTRDNLRRACVESGARRARVAAAEALLPLIREGVQREGRYAFLLSVSDDDFSLPLVRIRDRNLPREVTLFGESFRYLLTVYDETLIPDYPSYAAQRLGRAAFRQVATYRGDGTVSIDEATAAAIGEQQFLPQVEGLRAAAQVAQADAAFLRRAEGERLGELLLLAKQGLRWRSLEQLWSLVQGRPNEERLRRFVEDYTARAELRAATELRELFRMMPPGAQGEAELDDEQRQRLFELGTLSAIVHGEPLGQVADVLALTALSLQGPRHEPPFRAARQLTLDLVAAVRDGPPGEEADALALARLCRATPDELRQLALTLYRQRAS